MNNSKRKTMVVCALVQALFAIITTIIAFLSLFKWAISGGVDTFMPTLYDCLLTIFKNDVIAKVLAPILAIFLNILLLTTSGYMFKKPFDKKSNKLRKQWIFVVVAFVINLFFAIFCLLIVIGFGNSTLATMFAVAFGLVAIFEFISLFLPHEKMIGNQNTTATDSNANNNQPTTQQQPTSCDNQTQQMETPKQEIVKTWYIEQTDFEQRITELYRLAKSKNITDANLVECLQDLMTLPVQAPYDLKIKHLNKFSSNGFLTQQQISKLICQAITTKNTSTVKKRIKYLESLKHYGVVNEYDYSLAIRILMTYHE